MAPSNYLVNKEGESDLKYFIQLVIKNYRLFLVSLGFAFALAFMANRLITPMYKVSSSLLITEEPGNPEGGKNEYLNSNLFNSNQNLQNELWILKSVPTINQTIENLNLTVSYFKQEGLFQKEIYGKEPFKVLLLSNHIQPVEVRFKITIVDKRNFKIEAKGKSVSVVDLKSGELEYVKKKWSFERKGKFGNLIETSDMAFMVMLKPDMKLNFKLRNQYSFVFTDYITLGNELKKHLSFNIVDKLATVIGISYKSTSIRKGKDIVNELMEVYSKQNLDQKNHIASVTINYIDQQLNDISDSLSLTEESLQSFRSSNYLLNVNEQANNFTTKYSDLQNQLAELMTRKRYYDYVAEYLHNNEDFSSMIVPASMGIPDQLLNNLMSELISSQTERLNLIQNDQEFNPLVGKLTIKIENIKKTILKNISAVRKTIDISIDEMNKRIRQLETSISRLPVTQLQLSGLERKYKLNDAIYNYLLEKRAEAKITLASNIPNNIIIGPAHMVGRRPVSPNKQINYTIALLFGLVIPIGYLTLRNTLNNKLDNQDGIENLTGAPVFGKIMHDKNKTTNDIYSLPGSFIIESFRALRTNLEYQFMNISPKVILITSSIEGEGKSFTSCNLAYSYAQLGYRTLLVNFDLRKATKYFSEKEDTVKGLYSWYAEGVGHADIIQHSPYENLDYIQNGYLAPDPAKLFSLNNTGQLLNQLKEMYDCIILDTSPIALVSDAYLLMDFADIKIVIARYNHTIKKVFALIMEDLTQKDIKNVGVVMNDNRLYSNQYGYGYGYDKQKGKGTRLGRYLDDAKKEERSQRN
ncbi:polysaccharide biosynthesis tyrosine autokinase [Marinilabiliaceae bacterium JC017]|nr:polysaccharide biosynthesis tyrosine autokinase [Marinilabiliaceae bacterium JC017]